MRNRYRALNRYELKSLLYHLTEAGRWEMVSRVYMDLELTEALFENGVQDGAIEDYSLALEKMKPYANGDELGAMQALIDFTRSQYDYLKQYPEGVIQQAENQPDDSPVRQAAFSLLKNVDVSIRPRFRWINKATSVGPLSLRLRGQTGWLNCCAWTSDEEVVSANHDGGINIWNVRSGKLISARSTSGAEPITFSADASFLLASESDRVVIIDSRTGVHTGEAFDTDLRVASCAWSRDGLYIVIGGDRGELIVWSRESGRIKRLLKGDGPELSCCAWSPNGRHLVWCEGAEPLIVWDFHNSKQLGKLGDARMVVKGSTHTWTTFKGHKGGANACAWSPNGQYIASGSGHGFAMHDDDFSVRIWDPNSMKEVALLTGHQDRVTSLSWSPDSRWLASTSGSVMTPGRDNSVRIWDMKSLKARAVLTGHTNEVVSCAWHSDARRLVSASKDETLIVWDAQKSGDASDPILRIYVSCDGKKAALARKDNGVAIIETSSGKELERFYGHEDEISACAWSPNGLLLATGSLDRTARLWDIVQRKNVATLRGHSGDETYTAGGNRVVWGTINDMAWSPDGELLATAGSDRVLMVWNRQTLDKHRKLLGHVGPIVRCGWSSDGKRLVSRGGRFEHIVDDATLLWDVQNGCELGRLSSDDPDAEALLDHSEYRESDSVVSPDGLGVVQITIRKGGTDAWHSYDVEITHAAAHNVWKMETTGLMGRIIWFPDGRHVVLASGSSIRLLDAVAQREILRFPAMANLAQVCLALGGRRVLAIDQAGSLYILAVEGIPLGTPAMKASRRWNEGLQDWEKNYSGTCPLCGCLIDVDADTHLTTCPQCESKVLPIPSRTSSEPRRSLIPLDEQNGEAWLRMIRGLIINETIDDDQLVALYRKMTSIEPEGKTFTSAIQDPYSHSIPDVNSALWQTGAFLLWGEEPLAEKCLRTALRHTPDREGLKGKLACLLIANGKNREGRKLANTIASSVLTAAIHEAVDLYRELGDTASTNRLCEFAAANRKPQRRKPHASSRRRK